MNVLASAKLPLVFNHPYLSFDVSAFDVALASLLLSEECSWPGTHPDRKTTKSLMTRWGHVFLSFFDHVQIAFFQTNAGT